MVLKPYLPIITCLLLCLLSACANLDGSKKPPIVPVQKPPTNNNIQDNTKPLNIFKVPTPSIAPPRQSKENTNQNEPAPKTTAQDTNILVVLFAKADKAINNQQWLRAQRVLEQAIRIDAKKPSIYIKYGDLYQKMGASDKALSMYKRALYLATGSAKLKKQITQKLDSLEHSN